MRFLALLITLLSFNLTVSSQNNMEVTLKSDSQISLSADTYEIICTVTNTSEAEQKFCKFYTPFEGINGDIFTIKKGWFGSVDYKGVMKKRTAPTEDDYISLAPGESKTTTVNLKKAYDFSSSGTYKIQFCGRTINGLPHSNKIKVNIN